MSGSQPAGGGDPSMEDILASIRRILNEDDAAKPADAAAAKPEEPDVFALDASMMVAEPPPVAEAVRAPAPEPERFEPPPRREPVAVEVLPPVVTEARAEPPPPLPAPADHEPASGLVAPEAAAAAAHSVGSLRRTLEAGRALSVRSGGPTLDEMVREELRPVLKAWLDAHLPAMVERLVQAEIERVVSRADL